jgi:hypothetical protein
MKPFLIIGDKFTIELKNEQTTGLDYHIADLVIKSDNGSFVEVPLMAHDPNTKIKIQSEIKE